MVKRVLAMMSVVFLLTACSGANSEEGLQAIEQGDKETASEQVKGEEAEWVETLERIEEQSSEEGLATLQTLRETIAESDHVPATLESKMKEIEEQKQSLHAAWSTIDALMAEGAYEEAPSILESIREDVPQGDEAKFAEYERQLKEAMK